MERTAADTSEVRRVQILNADVLIGDVLENGTPVRRLIGHVRLRQGPTRLRAERAVQYETRDEILFTGDVRIIDEGDTLTADRVLYDTARKVGRATGHVRLTDGEVVVRAPSGRYFSREERAVFREGVTLIDSTSTLRSREGEYFTEEKRAEFYGNVRLQDEGTYLEADSVTYFRETDVSIARGRVFVERLGGEEAAAADTTTRTLLFGHRVYNDDETGFSRVDGQALLVQLRADSTGAPRDTLLMRAEHLPITRTDTLERPIAIDSVRIWQEDLAAVADSAVYDRWFAPDSLASDSTAQEDRPEREVTRLFQDPVAWHARAQLSGDTIRVTGRNRSVDTLFVYSGAFVAQLDTALQRKQQLKGRGLTAFFEQDSLRRLVVGPNAQAIRFIADEEGRLSGAVRASSDTMRFWIRGGELQRMVAFGGIQGKRYPEGEVPDPFRLEGYRWLPERRPTKEALLADERVRKRLRELEAERPPPRPPVAATEEQPQRGGKRSEDGG